MFFFLFGWGPHAKDLGPGAEMLCARCHNRSTTRRVRTSMQITVFFVPVLRWHRQTLDACTICGRARPATTAQPEQGGRELRAAWR